MSGVQLDNLASEISCKFGFAVKLEWLGEVVQQLQTAHAGAFLHMPREQQLQLVLEQLLDADLRVAGAGGHLPAAVKDLHKQTVQGKFMLQLDEAVNIAAGFRDRYREQGPNRCLKLHLTDGVQSIVAMEYRHIPALAVLMPAGLKLLLVNPEVRRGMLLLQPENVVVLGGTVAHLEAARQSLLQHVNKPADHCAQRRTCEQIYQQAAQAAWAGPQQQQHQQQQQQPSTSAAAGVGQAAYQGPAPGTGVTATTGCQQQQQVHQQQSGQLQQQQYADTGHRPDSSTVHQIQQQQTWQQQAPQQAQQQQQVHQWQQRQQQQTWRGISHQGTMPPPAPRQTPPSANNQQGQQQHSAVNAINAGSRVAQINSSGQVWSNGNAAAAAGNSGVVDDVEDYGFDEDEQLLDVSVPLGNTTVAATAMASRAGDDINMGIGVDNSDTDMTTDDEQLQQHEQQQRQQPGHNVYPDSTDFPALGLQQQQRRQQQQLPADDVGSSSDDDIEIIEAEHTAAATIARGDQQLQQPPYQQQLQQPLHEGSDSDGDFLDHALDQQLLALQSAQKLAHGMRLTNSNEDILHAPQGMRNQQPRQQQPQQQRVDQHDMDWQFDEPQQQAQQQQQQQPILRRRRKRQLQIPDDSSDDDAAAGTTDGSDQPHARQQQRQGQQQQQRMASFGDDVGNVLPKSPQTVSRPMWQQQQQQRLVGTAAHGVRTPPPDVEVSGTPAAAVAMADVPDLAVEFKVQHINVGTGSGGSSGGGGSGLGSGFGSRRMLSVSQRKREIQMSQQQQAPASSQQQQQSVEPWRPQHANRLSLATQKAASVLGQQQEQQEQEQHEAEADNMVSPIDTFTPSAQHTDNQVTRPSTAAPLAAAAAAAGPDMPRRRTSGSSAPQPLTLQKSDPLRGRRSSAAADCMNVAAATGSIVNGIDRESGMAAAAAGPAAVAAAGVGSQKPAAAMTNSMGTSDWYGSLLQDLGCADDADGQTHDSVPVSAAAASGTKTKLPSSSSRVISSAAVRQDNAGNIGNARRTAGASGSGSSRMNAGSGSSKLSAGSGGSRQGACTSSDSKRVGANIKSLFARVNEFAAAGALPLKQQSSNGGLLSQQQAGKLAGQQRAAAADKVIVLDEDLDDPGALLEDWD